MGGEAGNSRDRTELDDRLILLQHVKTIDHVQFASPVHTRPGHWSEP